MTFFAYRVESWKGKILMDVFKELNISYYLIFLLFFQSPVIMSAFFISSLLPVRNFYERLGSAMFIYSGTGIFLTALSGVLGLLRTDVVFLMSLITCIVSYFLYRKHNASRIRMPFRISLYETLVVTFVFAFFACNTYLYLSLPSLGTDSLIYHLFYPAMWIRNEAFYRVARAYSVVEYYPNYGEWFFCWFMLPLRSDAIAKGLQYIVWFFSFFSMAGVISAMGFRRPVAAYAAAVTVMTGVVFRNASVANTDLMVGYFMVSAAFLATIGFRRKSTTALVISGLAFGLAFGTKYIGILLVPILGFFMFLMFIGLKRLNTKNACIWIGASILAGMPYYFDNWLLTGNPFFPAVLKLFGRNIIGGNTAAQGAAMNTFSSAWSFYVNSDKFSLSFWSALLFIAALSAFLVIIVGALSRWNKRQKAAYISSSFFALYFIVGVICLILFIPTLSQPRQIIPAIMPFGIIFAPIFSALNKTKFKWIAVLLCFAMIFLNSFTQSMFCVVITSLILMGVMTIPVVFRNRLGEKGMVVLGGAILCACIYLGTDQIYNGENNKESVYQAILGKYGEIYQFINNFSREKGKGITIASLSDENYLFCGPQFRNHIVYIPIDKAGKKLYHEYKSPKEIRQPDSFKTWLARLRKEQVELLVIDHEKSKELANRGVEIQWAHLHPEIFKLIYYREMFLIYQVAPENELQPGAMKYKTVPVKKNKTYSF